MTQFKMFYAMLGFGLLAGLTSCTMKSQQREPAWFGIGEKQELDAPEIEKNSSSGFLSVAKARLIVDNDAAFDAKLEAVKSARSGETIRLSYYIYSNDYSSSVFTSELLKAARRGVNVRILADLISNYWLLDYFNYIEAQSDGRIKVRLFGKPNEHIIRDVVFLTRPCPEQTPANVSATYCSDYKWKTYGNTKPDIFAKMLLSGIYSKSASLIKTAAIMGQQIDVDKLTSGTKATAEEKKQLLEFLRLVFDSKVKKDPKATVKMVLALNLYGKQLNPVMNTLYGHVPFSQNGQESSLPDWEHSTDFTHHKLLMVGNRYVQLGGRNIEDSYHMKPNSLTKKYIFDDTDFAMELSGGGEGIAKAFDELYSFAPMTASLGEIRQLMSNHFAANPEATEAAVAACTSKNYTTREQRERFGDCVDEKLTEHPQYRNLEKRMADMGELLSKNAQIYRDQYLPEKRYTKTWRKETAFSDSLDPQEARHMLVTYIENVPYKRSVEVEKRTRNYGAKVGLEAQESKAIHELWTRGLQNACSVAAAEHQKNPNAEPKRVILHTAYYLPPTNLIQAFTQMINGKWDCSHVRVTILTNSFETTDLNAINILARYQMLAFFEIYRRREAVYGPSAKKHSATFDYYEYKKTNAGSGMSLHTKMAVLGNDVLVGSANADPRSYFMDTNNGVYMRNVPGFVEDYTAYVDGLLGNGEKVRNITPGYLNGSLTLKGLQQQDAIVVDQLMKRFHLDKHGPEVTDRVHKLAIELGSYIYGSTQKLMARKYVLEGKNLSDAEIANKQNEIANQFNRLLQLF